MIVTTKTDGDGSSKIPSNLKLDIDNEVSAPGWAIFFLGLYLMVVFLALVFLLIQIWPIDHPSGVVGGSIWKRVTLSYFRVPDEARVIFIVLMSGAIGGMIHALQSFVGFVGSNSFVCSWIWWYVLRPVVGAGLALLFYLSLRGGLLTTTAGVADLSIFGFASVSALAGLFSEQATAKLKELFDTMFKTDDQRPNKLKKVDKKI